MINSGSESNYTVRTAVHLGWLTVEAFGRFRRWAKTKRRPKSPGSEATKRFTFSDRDMNLYEELLVALARLKVTAAQLIPDLMPPIPDNLELFLESSSNDLNASWGEFESWSREVWNTLQIQDPLVGRAYTYGGSLADTYWDAYGADPDKILDKLSNLLRSYRLDNIIKRYDSISDQLPVYSAEVIHYTLNCWSIGEQLKNMDDHMKKNMLKRLEAQTKVWHDVLFGIQRAENYLRTDDRRQISIGAFAATAMLVILVGFFVWLAVMLLAGVGRTLLASVSSLSDHLIVDSSQVIEELLNYLNWSSLLATISSVVVVLTGIISHLSGWILKFHNRAREWLTLRKIHNRTYRHWSPPKD